MQSPALCLLLLAALVPAQALVDVRAVGGRPPVAVAAAASPQLPPRVVVPSVRIEMTDSVAHTLCELRISNPNGTDLAGRLLLPLPPRVIPGSVKITLAGSELAASTLDSKAALRTLRDAVRAGAPAAMLSGAGAPHLVVEVPLVAAAAETVFRIEHAASVTTEGRTARHELLFASGLKPEACQARLRSQWPIAVVHAGGDDVTIARPNENTVELKWIKPGSHPRVLFQSESIRPDSQINFAGDVDGSRVFALYLVAPETDPVEEPLSAPAPRDIVFVLDTSGSMRGEHALLAREICSRMLAKLGARDRVALVSFSTEARLASPLVAVDTEGLAVMTRALEAVPAAGGTNLVAGIDGALRLVDPQRDAHVVLLTDGPPTVGPTATRSVLEHVRKANLHQVPVHVVTPGLAEDASLLDMLAELTGGSRLRVPSLTDVSETVASLQQQLGPVVLHIDSIKVEGGALTELTLPERRGTPAGGRVLVTGRIASATDATLKVETRIGGDPWSMVRPVPHKPGEDEGWVAGLHGIRWLGHQLTRWREAGEPETGRREIEAWGLRYGIATPFGARVFGGVAAQPQGDRGRTGAAGAPEARDAASLLAFKQAQSADTVRTSGAVIRRAGARIFVRADSGWVETRLAGNPQPSDGERLTRMVEGSEAWCQMLDEAPELAPVLALEAPILFELAGRLIQIVAR